MIKFDGHRAFSPAKRSEHSKKPPYQAAKYGWAQQAGAVLTPVKSQWIVVVF
jgi:hypothetical protein